MIERKKEYMLDALGELEDRFVAEAIDYQKKGLSWKYTKELGTMAACAAVLFLAVTAYRLLPIGVNTEKSAKESIRPESAVEELAQEEVKTADKENTVLTDSYEKKQFSKGVSWEVVVEEEKAEESNVDKVIGSGQANKEGLTQNMSTSCIAWMSAEEILALDRDIFEGTITGKEVYHLTGGVDTYFTVVTVEVTDSLRGELVKGDSCRIYLPCAQFGAITVTNSIVGDLDKLEVGSRAVYIPVKATAETIYAGRTPGGEAYDFCYADVADYFFSEGMRFLFLEGEDGVKYEKSVFKLPKGETVDLEDITAYIRDMLDKQ